MFKKIPSGWLVLFASLIYLGTAVWQHFDRPAPAAERGAAQNVSRKVAAVVVPPPAFCDKIPHYTPGVRPQLMGQVVMIDKQSLVIQDDAGKHTVVLTPETEIYRPGKRKPAATYAAEMAEFTTQMKSCQDDRRVYYAPDPSEHVAIAVTAIKKKMGTQILLDDRDGGPVDDAPLAAAHVMVVVPLSFPANGKTPSFSPPG